MASKSVYQEFDPLALKHFGLESAPIHGVLTNQDISKVMVTDSEITYDNIKTILGKDTLDSVQFKTKKKGFLLPSSPISADRVKAACKEHKIILTNDYEDADFIITHPDFRDSFSSGNQIKSNKLICKLWNYTTFTESNTSAHRGAEIDEWCNTTGYSIIYDQNCNKANLSSWQVNDTTNIYDGWYLTGMAVNIAYKIAIGELDVIDVNIVANESATKQVLNEQLLKDLIRQVTSYNDEDLALAAMILPTIDYVNNKHLLWELAQNISSCMYKFNRNKDVQYWKEMSKFNTLYNYSAQDMIFALEKSEELNSENFRYLEVIVRKEIKIHNRDLYVFKVEVKPEYRKYLKQIPNEKISS
jgi:hypothetical protein